MTSVSKRKPAEESQLNADIIVESGEDRIYRPGEEICGQILLKVDPDGLACKGVSISVTGEASTHFWDKKTIDLDRKNRDWHYDEEQYFKMKRIVFGNGTEDTFLPYGVHEFFFSEILPEDIPSSYKGKYGMVKYCVLIRVIRSGSDANSKNPGTSNPDLTSKKDFRVMSTVEDLNNISSASKSQSMEIEKRFGCLCCMSEPLFARISTNKTGFVPGEAVLIEVKVKNMSNMDVKEVSVILQQKVTFFGLRHGNGQQHSERDSCVIGKIILPGTVNAGENKEWQEELLIPDGIPPSELMNCSLMDINYVLRFNVVPSGWRRVSTLHCELPFIIGTVPIQERASLG